MFLALKSIMMGYLKSRTRLILKNVLTHESPSGTKIIEGCSVRGTLLRENSSLKFDNRLMRFLS